MRVAYRGPYELRQLKFLSPYRSSPLDENIDEVLIVRNPAYSFVLVKAKGDSKYTVQDLYNDRDGVLQDQTINGLLTSTSGVLTGLFIGDLRLRDLLDADTFKIELVEKLENQYRLVFQCNVPEDECHRILGGELFFNAEDYSLEERKYNGEFCIPDVVTIPWVRQNKYVYGDWEGIKYPKSIETRFEGNDITSHSMLTIHSFRLGAPNKKEFYLKYYGIPEPKSPRQFPISVFVMIIGVLLIGLGVYLKIRAAKRAAKSAQ